MITNINCRETKSEASLNSLFFMCELNWLFGLYCFSGNSLSGAYTEPENSYERRRKARSNDFLDRIDISVISTTTKSAANTTTTNKRKLTPKMNRIGKKHAKKMYDCLVTNWVHTYLLKTWILKLVWNGTIWSIIGFSSFLSNFS